MKPMRTAVATVMAATLSLSAFSAFAATSLTGRVQHSLRRCMRNGLILTRKKPVTKLTTGDWFLRRCEADCGQYR